MNVASARELGDAEIERALLTDDRATIARADRERTQRLRRSGRAVVLKVGDRFWGAHGDLTRSRRRAYPFEDATAAKRRACWLVVIGVADVDGYTTELFA